MRVLWPPPPGPGWRAGGRPERRAVVAASSSAARSTSAAGRRRVERHGALDLPRVEALKVAHHGSADEGLPALLERLRPQFAAIEVGRGNDLRPPGAGDAGRAGARAATSYRTDRDGTVRLVCRGRRRCGW